MTTFASVAAQAPAPPLNASKPSRRLTGDLGSDSQTIKATPHKAIHTNNMRRLLRPRRCSLA